MPRPPHDEFDDAWFDDPSASSTRPLRRDRFPRDDARFDATEPYGSARRRGLFDRDIDDDPGYEGSDLGLDPLPTGQHRPVRRRNDDRAGSTTRPQQRPAARRAAGTPTRRRSAPPPVSPARRWLPAAAAAAVLGAVVVAGMSSSDHHDGITNGTQTPQTLVLNTELTVPPGTTPIPVVETDPAVVTTHLKRPLRKGSVGESVTRLQNRLMELGFVPTPDGKATGQFGPLTRAAVWAFEKLIMGTPATKATGVVTDEMWQVMQGNVVIPPRRPNAPSETHLEIYLPEQVAIVFTNGEPKFISHVSTGKVNPDGTPYKFNEIEKIDTDDNGDPIDPPRERPIYGFAKTPPGVFKVTRKIEGVRNGALGGMLNPVYFNFGVAIHGGAYVPLTRESHGCIRVPNPVSHFVLELLDRGDYVYVWDGKKEPEKQTKAAMTPDFNKLDPSATTTTTAPPSTSSSKPTTSSTKPSTSTTKPNSTTTTTKKSTTTTIKKSTTTTTAAPPGTTGS